MGIEIRGMVPLLSVFDMDRSLAFYRDILGFQVMRTSAHHEGDAFGWCLLRGGDVELMLNTAFDDDERPATTDPSRDASHHDTILYFGCPDPDGAYEFLQTRGVDPQPPETAYWGARQVYVHDPDGYNLCFQWPADKVVKRDVASAPRS